MLPWTTKNRACCVFLLKLTPTFALPCYSNSIAVQRKHGTSWSGATGLNFDMPGRLRRGNYPVWRAILLSVLSQAHPPVRDGTRHCTSPVLYEIQHARGCSVPLRRLTSTPVASTGCIYKAPSAIFLAPHPLRIRILSHVPEPMPWPLLCTHERTELSVDLFSVGEGSTCGAESNRLESVQHSGETPQRNHRTRQSGVENATTLGWAANADGDSN